ncbi:MAG: PAC2 family protein [Chloroflexi bacterium]|nr:PAC2 family protein [Chloroflexota bacterium]
MSIKYIIEPELINPVMIASWPGIGNIGLIAVDNMRRVLQAEQMAYMGGRVYAEGSKAYTMANLVLDVAEKYGCKRIYTSGAAVASIHHTTRSHVWVVPNSELLLPEIKNYDNSLLMSDIEGRGGQGNITGLNGLLLGVAKRRGIEAVCIMGEIPVYLQGFPFTYPKASKSVLEVLAAALGVSMEMEIISRMAEQSEQELSSLYEKLPPEIKEQLDRLRQVLIATENTAGSITEEDKKKILEDIDRFFKREGRGEQH